MSKKINWEELMKLPSYQRKWELKKMAKKEKETDNKTFKQGVIFNAKKG